MEYVYLHSLNTMVHVFGWFCSILCHQKLGFSMLNQDRTSLWNLVGTWTIPTIELDPTCTCKDGYVN